MERKLCFMAVDVIVPSVNTCGVQIVLEIRKFFMLVVEIDVSLLTSRNIFQSKERQVSLRLSRRRIRCKVDTALQMS